MADETLRNGRLMLLHHLLDAHRKGATGALEYEVAGRTRRILLRSGAVVLPPENALAADVRAASGATDALAWEPLLQRLASSYVEDGVPRSAAVRRLERVPEGVAGPVPTGALLRRAFALAAMAGIGESPTKAAEEPLVSDSDPRGDGIERPCWSQEELWVLERLRQERAYAELERECPFQPQRLLGVVAGLRALDLLRPAHRARGAAMDSGLLKLAELLRARIGASLRERPLGLLDDALQRRLEALVRRGPRESHYDYLEVSTEADESEIRKAFEELARQVHPSHAERAGIHVSPGQLQTLFERAVAAIRTLGDPVLRAEYDGTHGIVHEVGRQDSSDRRVEIAELARREFDRARYEERNGDLHTAMVLYEQAATLGQRGEYWAALARLQARNPAWSGRALESYRRAVELDPDSGAKIRFAMAEVLERAGKLDEAVSFYQAVAAGEPSHAEAQKALRRLAALGHGKDPGSAGGLGKFLRRG